MAGTLHQGILFLFQDDPWLAFDILGVPRPVDGTPLDRRAEVERDGAEPMSVRQGFPDLVLVHEDPDDETVGIVITVEAQGALDRRKRWMIPVYQSHLAADHELPCWVVMVSLDPEMSLAMKAWAQGQPPKIDALLLDVDSVSTTWLEHPTRILAAVLAGVLHGSAGDYDAARRGFHAALSLRTERGRRHALTVLAALPKHQVEQLMKELSMQEQEQDPWLEVERSSGLYQLLAEHSLEVGRDKGLKEGLQEGAQALVTLIFELLGEHDVSVDPDSEARIRNCDDLQTLQRWVRRSFAANSVTELFAS